VLATSSCTTAFCSAFMLGRLALRLSSSVTIFNVSARFSAPIRIESVSPVRVRNVMLRECAFVLSSLRNDTDHPLGTTLFVSVPRRSEPSASRFGRLLRVGMFPLQSGLHPAGAASVAMST